MKKYEIGTIINNKWVIVSSLYTRKQNRKLLCFNLETNIIKEGWIWDFTRDLVNTKPNRSMFCQGFLDIEKTPVDIEILMNEHFELASSCYYKHNWLTRDEFYFLQCLREGSYIGVQALLKKFDWLLYKAERNNKEKAEIFGAKNSKKLAKLILLTYCILNVRGYFNK